MTTIFKPDQVRYERECKLGEGLNSNVWRATRTDFNGETRQACALKLPKDQTAVSFLRREYEVLQRVASAHVVRAIAWESFNSEPALVLEWIDGVTLEQLAKQTRVNVTQRNEITRQIDQALKDIAKVGACHGDLHPGNIMIDRDGRVVLIDFASGKTADGLLQATPAFVAPEIWAGADFSYPSDVFALKVIHANVVSGFRELSGPSHSAPDYKIATENVDARREIAAQVNRLLVQSQSTGTQVIELDIEAAADPRAKSWTETVANRPHRHLIRAACALGLIVTLHLPVLADDPQPEPPGSAKITVTSRKWMQIKLNGEQAGYTPVKLQGLKSGIQHLEWKTASQSGEFHFPVKAGDTVRLVENERGQLVVVPSKVAR